MNESEQKQSVKCPECGAELTEDVISQLMKKEEKEFGFLILGVVFGAVLGIMGNLWVSLLIEVAKGYITSSLWPTFSIIGLAATTVLSVYILVRMIKWAVKYTKGEGRLTVGKGISHE
jgi:hypothetical protein